MKRAGFPTPDVVDEVLIGLRVWQAARNSSAQLYTSIVVRTTAACAVLGGAGVLSACYINSLRTSFIRTAVARSTHSWPKYMSRFGFVAHQHRDPAREGLHDSQHMLLAGDHLVYLHLLKFKKTVCLCLVSTY
jgi:hypothetical protein